MAPDPRWEELKSIVGRAGEFAGREREEFLRAACRDDRELRAEAERLLAAGERDDDFILPPPWPSSEPHFALGEFHLMKELGRGSTAIVYLARQERLHREVAIKVLVESPLTTPEQLARFHGEARSVARLDHPGIVRVLSDGCIDRTHWFAMDFVAGHDLARELALHRKAPESGAVPLLPRPGTPGHMAALARVAAEAAEALHHAHQHGLIHRDVKPQNLLLDPQGRVRVVDFGLAHDDQGQSLTGTRDLLGTVPYMSPEQTRPGAAPLDARSDVYSLGAVLYELCTLRRPIEGATLAELLARIPDEEPTRPRRHQRGVPRDLEAICLKALAKSPSQRYADAGALAEDLRRFLRHEAVVAKPPGWIESARRFTRRHRLQLLAGGLVLGGSSLASWFTRNVVLAHENAQLTVWSASNAGSVALRNVDPITGMPAVAVALGELPLANVSVAPGYYRIEVSLAGELREFTRELESGEELRLEVHEPRPLDRQGMVWIPGGTLALRDENAPLNVLNGRDVPIEGFWVDACEVTIGQYAVFLAATRHTQPDHWDRLNTPANQELPVVYVGWRDAQAYAEWAGKRLPTFSEWNWVARGAEGRRYPWGDSGPIRGNALHPQELVSDFVAAFLGKAARVGSFPTAATPEGVHDLFGNVAEWTETPLAEIAGDGLRTQPAFRIAAGHSWDAATFRVVGHSLETFEWAGIENAHAEHRIGFRCARSN